MNHRSLLGLSGYYERLCIKYGQHTTNNDQAVKTHYMQIVNINKLANSLWDLIAKAQYTEEIKSKVKSLADMAGKFAEIVYKNGTTKDNSIMNRNNMNSIADALKNLIKTNTFLPFDELLKALNNYTPIDVPAQDPNAPKPEQTNPENVPATTPVAQSTQTSVAPSISGGVAGI